MACRSITKVILFAASLVGLVLSPGFILAQQTTSAGLRNQAARLRSDLEVLKQSKSDLGARASGSLLSAMEKESGAKENLLASTEAAIQEAEALEKDLADLSSTRDKMKGHISSGLLDKLNEEIAGKQLALAKLLDSTAVTAEASSNDVRTSPLPHAAPSHPPSGFPFPSSLASAPDAAESPRGGPENANQTPKNSGKAPATPSVNPIAVSRRVITGKEASKDSKIEVTVTRDSRPISQSHPDVDSAGRFEIRLDDLRKGDKVQVKQTNPDGQAEQTVLDAEVRTGEMARAIIGFDQAGASSTESARHFFFDFFISRPLPGRPGDVARGSDSEIYGPKWRWWGNVRIASAPQATTTAVAAFAAKFATQVGNLKVNELAQSAEFLTGLDRRLFTFHNPLKGEVEDTRQRFVLGAFFGAGATGVFHPPQAELQLFSVPAADSPQAARFAALYPTPSNVKYVGFIPPDRDQFFRQYYAGVRLATYYLDLDGESLAIQPAMVSVAFGQNELVTEGELKGIVARDVVGNAGNSVALRLAARRPPEPDQRFGEVCRRFHAASSGMRRFSSAQPAPTA